MADGTFRATDTRVGMVIDWRGQRATVVDVWATPEASPVGPLFPVGIELEVEQATGPVRFRAVWPDLTAAEIGEMKRALADPATADDARAWFDAVLALHLDTIQLEVWRG